MHTDYHNKIKNTHPELSFRIVESAGLLSVVIAVLYISGWQFVCKYFSYFKLGTMPFYFPDKQILVYAFIVLKSCWWFVLAIGIAYIVIIFFLHNINFINWGVKFLLTIAILFTIPFLTFKLASSSAKSTYQKLERENFSSLPVISLKINSKSTDISDEYSKKISDSLLSGKYRLLIQNADSVWVVECPYDPPGAFLPTIQINKTNISFIQTLP